MAIDWLALLGIPRDASPASRLLPYLPRWYNGPDALEAEEPTEDVEMTLPEESVANMNDADHTDLHRSLRYDLLSSAAARKEQLATVRQLWQSVRAIMFGFHLRL